jgi:hypothetical protein
MEMVKGKMVKVPIEKDPGYEIVRPSFQGTHQQARTAFMLQLQWCQMGWEWIGRLFATSRKSV